LRAAAGFRAPAFHGRFSADVYHVCMKFIKRFVSLSLAICFVATPALATAAPGSLDSTFGRNGFQLFPHTAYSVNDVKIQSDGRIIVAGDMAGSGNAIGDFSLVRFLADGRIDKHFGSAGLAVAQFSPLLNVANSVAIQPDRKIVAVGFTAVRGPGGSARNMAIARFNPNGSLDQTFGSNGTVQLVVAGSTSCVAGVVLLQPDKKLLVGGSALFPSGPSGVVVRLRQNGAIDTAFGNLGFATTGAASEVNGLGLQKDGKIVALGGTSAVRFLANGVVDPQPARSTLVAEAHTGTSMLAQDETIVEATPVHDTQSGSDVDTLAQRLFPDGTIDPSFASPVFDFLSSATDIFQNEPFGVALQSDGSVIVAGQGQDMIAVFHGALARLTSSGPLDPTFGQGGLVTSILDGNDQFTAVALQPDGKIVAAGLSFANNGDLIVARYLSH
jgi:uncharacterized delta-60 repeat protein